MFTFIVIICIWLVRLLIIFLVFKIIIKLRMTEQKVEKVSFSSSECINSLFFTFALCQLTRCIITPCPWITYVCISFRNGIDC